MRCPRPHCNGTLRLEPGDVLDYGQSRLVCVLCGREAPMAMIQEERERMAAQTRETDQSPLVAFNKVAERYLAIKREHEATLLRLDELSKQREEARAAYEREYSKLDALLPRDVVMTQLNASVKPRKKWTRKAKPVATEAPVESVASDA